MNPARALLLVCLSQAVLAAEIERLPKIEIGVLGGSAYVPDYPAADQNHFHHLGAPYVIYRGNILRADRDGARAKLYSQRYFFVEMSFGGSFPANSKHNRARAGMEDLDWLGEIGPRVTVPIARWGTGSTLKLYLPFRAVFSSDFSNLHHRGFTCTPNLALRLNDFIRREWIGFLQVTGNFGTRMINSYLYDVPPAYQTSQRPYYDARAGYIATSLFSGLAIQLPKKIRLFIGGVLSEAEGSANQASPLFRRTLNVAGIAGLSWAFYESKTTGAVTD